MAQHRSSGAKDLVITCIKGDGIFLKFWALPVNALDTIKNLESHFLKIKPELDSSCGFSRSDQIPSGIKCVVKSQIKGHKWCRARVLGIQGLSSVVVQLMDYGNEEIVSVQNVRNVDDQILSIAPQAIECILADVVPARGNEWSLDAINFCEQHLLFNKLSCYVVSECLKLPVVRVAKKGENEAFVQRLINSGLALIKQETPTPPPLTYKMNGMDINTSHLVKVSCVENAYKFYVQLSAVEMELKNLMDSINKLRRESLTPLKVPVINTPCLALLSSKQCFYRALITMIQQNRCKVFFVDYGFSELKDVQDLRTIPPTFMHLPAQAICCSLPKDTNIDVDEFKRLINYEHLECFVLNRTPDSYIVKLIGRGQDLKLISRGPELQQSQTYSYMQQKLNPGAKCEVTVSYVNDLKEFYCQLTHFKEQQSAISTILNSGYNFIPIPLSECSPGRPVCVKFPEDNLWYRAQIVNVNHENDIEVFFVDFGNYDNVNLSDVKNIGPDALQFPTQAYKCYLYETLIPSDSKAKDDAFDMFEELTTDKCLLAHVHLVSGDSGYGITLYSKNSSVSINEKLQSTFLTVPTIPVKDTEKVFVTAFESASSFFAQFEKLDPDELTRMQEEINTFYSGAENVSFIPKVGSLVCAKFDEDEQFYRAKVETIKDGFCNVFFIDYGNRQTISIKDVHALDMSFTKYPQFGTSCAFENCPSEIPSDQLSSVILDCSIRVKFIRKDGDKWYVSLEENCTDNAALIDFFKQYDKAMPRSIHGAGLRGYQENEKIQSQRSDTEYNKVGHFNDRSESKKYPQNEVYLKKRESPPKTELAKEEFKDYSIISIPPKACRHVYVSHVLSPSEFYCQIEEESSKLQLLMKTIEDIYTTIDDSLKFTNFVIDAPCCAIYEDGAWYRGKIKKIGVDSCDVFFVDYGNISTVSKSEIKVLRSDLFRWPSQAIHCKSYNISPKGKDWNEDEINAFINMTLDKSFVAQFVDCDKNGVYAVNLVSIGKLENDIFNKEFVNLGFGRLQDPHKSLVLNSHAASNNLSFSPLPIAVGSSEPVEVTYGLNPGEIFCQLKSYSKNFKDMMLNLQDYYSKVSEEESLIDRPHQGMICVAQFFLDFAWYRAEIKKVEANKIVVFYVDYGNSETVDRKKVRCIIQDYTSLPIQAVKCRIRGIKPPGKTWTITKNLSKYFEGSAICKFISKENDYFLVDITCNQKDVAQSLISDGLAVSDSSIEPTVEIPVENKAQITQQILPERTDSFVSGQLLSVIVSYIENPSRFWCQLLDELDILDELMAEIGNKVSEFLPVNFSDLTVGSYCLALYSEDETWYRAQIKSFEPENNVYVFFIDYGNCEMVSKSQIKALPVEFTKHPALCFTCCLQNTPLKLLPEMTTLFRSTVEDVEEITAKVENFSSNCCTVSLLFDKDDQELNVSELLFGAKEDVAPPQFLPPDVPLGLHEGYVSTVNSPQDFYVQLSVSEDALADLSSELATASETLPGVKEIELCIGYACSSKYSEDNNWYRAEVINILDSTVEVLFVDYGNIDTVSKDSLINLTEKHLQIPPLAIKCKLNGIVPAADEWSEESINTFQDMVLESCLGITFISKDIPATVNIAKEDKDIAQSLVDIELANFESCAETDEAYAEDHLAPPPTEDPLSSLPNDQSYPERKLSSTKLVVKICYVDSYDKFYVTPLDLGTELDTVMTTLNILYASNGNSTEDSKSSVPDVLEDPKVSMPCVAKYSEDEAWCRAVITEVDGENIYVTFVDYGNSEITSLQNLRPLTPELVKIPPIAMECSLYGIEAVPGQEQQITAKLEEYYVEEHEMEMEICEFSPYKIRLNYNGDIATMFIKEGLAKDLEVPVVECEAFVNNSKMTFVDESLEYRTQISKRFFNGVDKIIGNVKFCEIENDLIVFHVVSADLDDELQNLQQKLQDAYSEAPGNLANAACMDFCATKYVEDENWYRAQVLSCDKDKVKVRFIDYGNCETVDRSDIYELLHEFTVAPQFSVKCILFGLKVNKSKEVELQNTLDEYVYHDHVEFTLCKNAHAVYDLCILNVVCLASDCDTNILELILKEQLVSQQYIVSTALDVRFKATVQQIESDVIYLLPSNLEQERDAFQSKLQHVCQDLNIISSEVQAHFLYAAKIENIWHRVSIIDSSTADITVYLVDFGLTKVVSVSDLVLLPTDTCHQPLFLYPCVIKAFNDLSGDVKEIDIQSLGVGKIVTCQLKKTYPLVHPYIVRIVEIEENVQSVITYPDSKLAEQAIPEISHESVGDRNTEIDLNSPEQSTKEDENADLLDTEGNKLDKSVTEEQNDIKTELEEVVLSKLDDKEFHESEISKPLEEANESQEAELKTDESLGERNCEDELTDLNEVSEIKDEKDEELSYDEDKMGNENESAINQDSQNLSEEVEEVDENVKESLDVDFESNECNKDFKENDKLNEKLVEKEPDASNQDESVISNCNNEEELREISNCNNEEELEEISNCNNEEELGEISNCNNEEELGRNETKLSEDNKSDFEMSTTDYTEKEIILVKENEQLLKSENTAEMSDKENEIEKVLESEQFSKDENIDEVSGKECDTEQVSENEQFSKDENIDEVSGKECDIEQVSENEQFLEEENEAELSDKGYDMERVEPAVSSSIDLSDTTGDIENDKSDSDTKGDIENNKSDGDTTGDIENNKSDSDTKGDIENNKSDGDTKGDIENNKSDIDTKGDIENNKSDSDTKGDIENNKSDGDTKTEDLNVNVEKDIINNLSENIDGIQDIVNSSNDTVKENNRGIEDSYQLSGSVQVKISEILINNGSVIFAVQPLYLEEEFSLLKQSMQDFYSSAGTAYDGNYNFCVVFFENEWCRGEVLQKSEDSTTVMLADYGKYVPNVDSSNLKNIEGEHSNIPPFAVWCTLSSVFCPLEKTETAKTFLSDKLKNSHAAVKILEGGKVYKINMFVDGSSVINMLLKNSLVTQRLPSMDLEPGSYRAKLSFLNINSKTVEIFITLTLFSSDYLSLLEIMQTSYKLEDSITNVVESGIYAAYYNNSWHRGSVISSGNDIQVFLIDTGEIVGGCKNLCFLLPEHCLQPAYAIPCHIPFTDVDATNEIFESISNVLKAADFLVNIDICSETNTISATVIDELIVTEVKNMGLSCNIPTFEKDETESLDNTSSCLKDTKPLLPESSTLPAVVVQQQETSEHLVGYLEETFTTESSS